MAKAPQPTCRAYCHFGPVAQLHQGVEGGLDDVVGVGRTQALGEYVLHPTEVITARTAPPAITPVPSGAGFNSTCPAP